MLFVIVSTSQQASQQNEPSHLAENATISIIAGHGVTPRLNNERDLMVLFQFLKVTNALQSLHPPETVVSLKVGRP